jgi:hypothetical protein
MRIVFFKFTIIIHLYARLSIWSYEKKEAVGVQPLLLFTKQKKVSKNSTFTNGFYFTFFTKQSISRENIFPF